MTPNPAATAAWIARSVPDFVARMEAATARQKVAAARFCADTRLTNAIAVVRQAQYSYVLALEFVAVANRGGAVPRAFKWQPIERVDAATRRQMRSEAFSKLNAARARCRRAERELAAARAAHLAGRDAASLAADTAFLMAAD